MHDWLYEMKQRIFKGHVTLLCISMHNVGLVRWLNEEEYAWCCILYITMHNVASDCITMPIDKWLTISFKYRCIFSAYA